MEKPSHGASRARAAGELWFAPGRDLPLSDAVQPREVAYNVIPFAHARRDPELVPTAPSAVSAGERSAPAPQVDRLRRQLALIACSLAVHGGLFAAFNRAPPPLPSIGLDAISIELVVGTNTKAGRADRPTESEAPVNSAAAPAVTPKTSARVAPDLMPEPAAAVERPRPRPERATATADTATRSDAPRPRVAMMEPEAEMPVATAAPTIEPAAAALPRRLERPPRPRPRVPAVVRASPLTGPDDAKPRASAPAVPSVASSGIGRGRSDAAVNYQGLVAAKLARNKQYPSDARRNGEQGKAVVSFTIAGSGNVANVALAHSSGVASLDREAVAMVRRAAPFPPPPARTSMSFTVPVTFNLQ